MEKLLNQMFSELKSQISEDYLSFFWGEELMMELCIESGILYLSYQFFQRFTIEFSSHEIWEKLLDSLVQFFSIKLLNTNSIKWSYIMEKNPDGTYYFEDNYKTVYE